MIRSMRLGVAIGFAMLTIATPSATAQTTMRMQFGDTPPTEKLTMSQRTFATAYVRAVTGRDLRQYRRLIHPASLACWRPDNEEIFQDVFSRHQGLVVRDPRITVESLPPTLKLFDFMAKQGLDYPVRPTHAFYVDLSTATDGRLLAAFSVLLDRSWYEVLPCPTAEAVVRYREKKAKDTADETKARELAASVRDPLRAELLALLKEGKSVSAMKKYAEVTGVDLAMARRVVKAMESPPR
jgi:hypothetical protein